MAVKAVVHAQWTADVETSWGTVHVYESPDGLIIDIWVPECDEPIWTAAWDEDDLNRMKGKRDG